MIKVIDNIVYVAAIYNITNPLPFCMTNNFNDPSDPSTINTILIANISVVIGSKTYFGYAVAHLDSKSNWDIV